MAAGAEGATADSVGKNLEERKVEVWWELVEVWVNSRDGFNKLFPLVPHAVLVGGALSRDASSGHCFCSAEIRDECMAGLRVTICQDWACG